MTQTSVIDMKALERLEEWGGRKLVAQMIDLFLSHAPVRMESLRAGLVSGDADTVERAAHSLKSTAANLGAVELGELAAQVEKTAGAKDLERVRTIVPTLEAEFDRARDALSIMERGSP